jgi:hypothetical protein
LKTLDSGFRRNDRKGMQANFFTASGLQAGIFPAQAGFAMFK